MAATALSRDLSTPDRPPALTQGMAGFARLVFAGGDIQAAWDAAMARATASPADPGAMLDLSTILQLVGQRDQGLALQADALRLQRHYRRDVGTGRGPTVLALVSGGDLMANTPLDFLLEGWNGRLDLMYLDPAAALPVSAPDHDLAILAIGESDHNTPLLKALSGVLPHWPRPVLNGAAGQVIGLGRDRAPDIVARVPGLSMPRTWRLSRAQLDGVYANGPPAGEGFPLIVRPVGSHAGLGLEKLEAPADLGAYLHRQAGDTFYLSPFVDYRGADGLFRKLRVALVGGRPFVAHMALSEHWMVHYLNAGMDLDPAKREAEADMMASFETGFAARHAAAFSGLAEALGLDYFAVDCAEDQDGRLLIFEADTAMIIHDMDPPDLYPYKAPAMAKLFAAFQDLLRERLAS